ncbi:DNA (cytosine-5-)-methyltransferase [Dehalococcoides mccartyi BTF08]|uniref:DNA cytosine methyltransferase n=1 Tax=Dehalococcoides mccartyi TaxID=61435 RepID=UPI0002B7607C|nr:DNA cytosine methyltransferase [Dehalococcoides mccartyi]AGG07345.1 DNA (cytosine-5-)-methyltransferase [Dehalococcoides mccartyi BTF08]
MRNAISLFSSSGIGDLGLQANGIETVVACELLQERMNLFQANYPNAKCFCGDIWNLTDEIIDYYTANFSDAPFMILATPPCQGMSSNGMGKMLSDFRKGLRPELDERNRLIIPTLNIIKRLQPEWVILENVANMQNTVILNEENELVNIIEYIKAQLSGEYVGTDTVIDCADYGIPQRRKRLLTVFSRTDNGKKHFTQHGTFLPERTHAERENMFTKKWVTVRDAIEALPPISSVKGKNVDKNYNPPHKVPLLDDKKIFWVENTPEGNTAFNNQCINPECKFQGNPIHGAKRDESGINRYNGDTPIYCEKCGALLPRPYVEDPKTGEKRLMKGYTSAYKRMSWDEPASTLTQNFQYACSDNKLHPTQNRVLSLYEGTVIQTISEYPFSFRINGKPVNDGLIRDTIGESVPPRVIDLLCRNIINIESND